MYYLFLRTTRLGEGVERTRFDHIPQNRVWIFYISIFQFTTLNAMKLIPLCRAEIVLQKYAKMAHKPSVLLEILALECEVNIPEMRSIPLAIRDER